MKIVVLIASSVIIFSLTNNLVRMYCVRHQYEKFKRYIDGEETLNEILQSKTTVLELLRSAGITDRKVPHIQYVDDITRAKMKVSVMDNYGTKDVQICTIFTIWFNEAIGEYRRRALNSMNPICWVKTVLLLPTYLLGYFSVSAESIMTKILQLIWWFAAPVFVAFRDDILEYIRMLFE